MSLFLLRDQGLQVGDHVMVHVGYAIQKIHAEAAQRSWELHEQMAALEAAECADPDHA